MRIMLLSALAFTATASATDLPYYPRSTQSNQDMGGLNADLSQVANCLHNTNNKAITPQSCPAGQALTGAFYNSCGTTFGGTCVTVSTFAQVVPISSSTLFTTSFVPNASTMATSVNVSTLTLTTTGGRVAINLNCRCFTNGSGDVCRSGVLMDGAYFDSQTSTKGFGETGLSGAGGSGFDIPISFLHITANVPSVASHNFVPVFMSLNGSTINHTNDVCNFDVWELH